MCQKEHLYFLDGLEHDLDMLVLIHGIVEVKERRVKISNDQLYIQILEAG